MNHYWIAIINCFLSKSSGHCTTNSKTRKRFANIAGSQILTTHTQTYISTYQFGKK